MTVVLSIIIVLILLGILIALHELGHFGAGKLLGFSILEYSIGMGPTLFKKTKNGTDYTLRAFPIGGMCRFEGEDEDIKTEGAFNAQPVWKRMIVVLAGPFMNIVLAILVGILLFAIYGSTQALNYKNPQVMELQENAAASAVMREGDYVTAIDGTPCVTADDMINAIRATKNDYIDVTVLRPNDNAVYAINGVSVPSEADMQSYIKAHPDEQYTYSLLSGYDELTVRVSGIYDSEAGYNRIGATLLSGTNVTVRYGVFGTIGAAFRYFGQVCTELVKFLGTIFSGKASLANMMGVVGIVDTVNTGVNTFVEAGAQQAGLTASYIVEYAIYLLVLLSINLGVLNALPIPALDGGRFVFMLIELIFRKPVPPKVENTIHTVGFALLMLLVVVVTGNDIFRIISGVIRL